MGRFLVNNRAFFSFLKNSEEEPAGYVSDPLGVEEVSSFIYHFNSVASILTFTDLVII